MAGLAAEGPLQIRIHGTASLPTLIYLPGLHGDWTLVSSLRAAVAGRARFVECTYPRSRTWALADYAAAVAKALLAEGISGGWLLAESFGSQIAWPLIAGKVDSTDRCPMGDRSPAGFQAEGLILAGGFVRHPFAPGAKLLRWLGQRLSTKGHHRLLGVYSRYARVRHRHAPETLASIGEFVARRTESDRQAMDRRLVLVGQNDPRPLACQVTLPVYYLAGLIDPLVPWVLVRFWLWRNCPGYRGGKTCWLADHNVLGTTPALAADQILKWINQSRTAGWGAKS